MLSNLNPSEIVSLQEFYQFAKKNTPIETWDYIIGAADTETTFKKNRYALDTYLYLHLIKKYFICLVQHGLVEWI